MNIIQPSSNADTCWLLIGPTGRLQLNMKLNTKIIFRNVSKKWKAIFIRPIYIHLVLLPFCQLLNLLRHIWFRLQIFDHKRKQVSRFRVTQPKMYPQNIYDSWNDKEQTFFMQNVTRFGISQTKYMYHGPCLITVIRRCRNPFSQGQCSCQRKLRSHWIHFLRQHHVAGVKQGPVLYLAILFENPKSH